MDSSHWRPLDPERSWRLGVTVAAGATLVVGLSLLLGGATSRLVWVLLASSIVLVVAARLLAPTVLVTGPVSWRLQYAWSVFGVIAAGALATSLEGGVFRYGLIFAVAAVGAGGVFTPLAHRLYQVLVLTVIVLGWVVRPAGTTLAQLSLYLGLFGALLYLIGELSGDLRRSLADESRTRSVIDDQSRVLRMVGTAASLDADQVFDVVVDAVVASGFDVASVGVVRDGVRHAVASRGFDGPVPPSPASAGVAGRAWREDRTVVVADYRSDPDWLPWRAHVRSAVATPIRTDRGVSGVLIGGWTEPGTPSTDDVEILELLALHAAHALTAVAQYEAEQRLVERLLELDELKRDFVSNVSHELRTPLTVVKGLGRTLATRSDTLGPERTRDLLDRINANSRRLGAMLGGLLDFSRVGSGELRVQRRPVDVSVLVRDVVSRFEPMLDGHRVDLDLDPAALAEADPTLIEHVLENLLGNVAKHTPAGTSVVLGAHGAGDGIEVSVTDDGPGIAPADIPLLTQRYYRGAGRDGVVQGSGVGLALVHEILEAHGARLEVRSDEGSGTTFAFRLPGVREAAPR